MACMRTCIYWPFAASIYLRVFAMSMEYTCMRSSMHSFFTLRAEEYRQVHDYTCC